MSAEFYKTKDLLKSLSKWENIDIKTRKKLITELGEMVVESTSSDDDFADACNSAANLLCAINQSPALLEIIDETHQKSNKK